MLFLSAIILASCTTKYYITTVTPEKQMPPVSADKQFYIYYSDKNILPDSAVYIGKFSTMVDEKEKVGLVMPPLDYQRYISVESKVKQVGGNLIFIDRRENTNIDKMYEGKVYLINEFENTKYTEDSLIALWEKRPPDYLEGIYETDIGEFGYLHERQMIKIGIVKKDNLNYLMVYLSGYNQLVDFLSGRDIGQDRYKWYLNNARVIWKEGDFAGIITKTAVPTRFTAKRLESNKYNNKDNTILMDRRVLKLKSNFGTDYYTKIYPGHAEYENVKTSLTGLALDKYRILTSYRVFMGADVRIYAKGINGDIDLSYSAVVEKCDSNLDVAVLRLVDTTALASFTPFPISDKSKAISEDVFVIGYPISKLLGVGIRYTEGKISSTTGIAGDVHTYQIAATIERGHSGSPLFDKNNNFIGMFNSGLKNAIEVGYSIKLQYIKEFLVKNGYKFNSQPENTFKALNYEEMFTTLQKNIYLIEIVSLSTKPLKKKERSISTW